MAERLNNVMKTWGGVVLGVIQFLTVVIFAPTAWRVIDAINALTAKQAITDSWIASHRQLVEDEKKGLRLEILSEVKSMLDTAAQKAEERQRELRSEIRDAARETQTLAVNVRVLGEQMTTMTRVTDRLGAELKDALVKLDFVNNK